jgi:hypothetical protein
MKKTTLLLLILMSLNTFSQNQVIQWQTIFGGTETDWLHSIQKTEDGGYIVAGSSNSYSGNATANGNHGGIDYLVVKLDSIGNIEWEKFYGGSGNDIAYSIQTTTDGGYIVAGASSSLNGDITGHIRGYDFWVIKLDVTGNIQWEKSLGGLDHEHAYSIQNTSDGGYILAGYSNSFAFPESANRNVPDDYFVVKLDSIGNIQWQKTYGGSGGDSAFSVQVTTDGGYIVAGTSLSNDGDVTGNHGSNDFWIVKLDASGNIEWEKSLGGSGGDIAWAIQITSDGGYIVAGRSDSLDGDVTGNHGSNDFWIVKLDTTGNIQWEKSIGGSGSDIAISIKKTFDGGYIVVGESISNDGDLVINYGSMDIWAVKIDAIGDIKWHKSIGGSNAEFAGDVESTDDGGFVVTGITYSYNININRSSTNRNSSSIDTSDCLTAKFSSPSLITIQPEDTFLCNTIYSQASISVECNATSAVYQWQYRVPTSTNSNPSWITITSSDDAIYNGFTTSNLIINRATITLPASLTEYRVLINDGAYTLVSNVAKLNIKSTTKSGTIVALPVNSTVCALSSVTFTLVGSVGTDIQWQTASTLGNANAIPPIPANWEPIDGAITNVYTTSPLSTTSNKYYRAIVTNSYCGTMATTLTKTITVNPLSVAGTVTGGGIVCSGSSSTLKVAGYVGKVQWQYSMDGVTFVNAPTAAAQQTNPFGTTSSSSTAATYLITGISADVYFRAKVSSGICSSAYSAPVMYTINSAASIGTISANSTLLCAGSGTNLTLTSAGGVITWEKATNLITPTWTPISNSNLLSILTGNLSISTQYRAKVTIGSCSTLYSNILIIRVVAKPLAKTIVTNITSPTGATSSTAICTSGTIPKILSVGTGYVGLIEWQVSTISATAGFFTIPGETGSIYTITNPTVGANYYRVRMYNTCGAELFGIAKAVYYKECSSAAKGLVASPFDLVAYPNPFKENFKLSVTTSSDDKIKLCIYDMLGRLIEQHEIIPVDLPELQVGDYYPTGVYNVVATQGREIKTIRLIKR